MAGAKDCKIITPKDLDTFASPDVTRQWYAGKNFTMGVAIHPGGGAHYPHTHEGSEEMLYTVAGNVIIEFLPDGGRHLVGPGDIVHIPAGVEHAAYVQGFEPWKVVCVYSPAGAEQYSMKGELIIPKGQYHDYLFSFEEGKYEKKE